MPSFVTFLTFLAVFFAAQFTAAESRQDVVDRIISRLGSVHNQEDTQLCFGDAVADVITWHTGQRVSSFSVVVRNFQLRTGIDKTLGGPASAINAGASGTSPYMGGLASSTLNSSLISTVCEDKQPEDNLYYRDEDLKALLDAYNTYRTTFGPTPPTDAFDKIANELNVIMPNLDASDFIAHLKIGESLNVALGHWFDRQCSIRMPDKFHVEGGENRMDRDELIRRIDGALAGGEIAVVHWDYRLIFPDLPIQITVPVPQLGFLDGLLSGVAQWFNETAMNTIGFHVSTIVAKRIEDGHAFYLLRNSWGARCDDYPTADARARCDRGHFWLSEKEVRDNVTSTAYYWPDGKKL